MREMMLYMIDRSLKKAVKNKLISQEHLKVLGQPGSGKNLSAELTTYLAQKKLNEQKVLCRTEQSGENIPHHQFATVQQSMDGNMGGVSSPQNSQFAGIGPHCLIFDSFFECGNLERAEYVSPTEYNLYLNVDTNTKGHQQWFYFKAKNTFKDKKYTFNIRNFTKPFSLYKQGMKILMKSTKKRLEEERDQSDSNDEWVAIGDDMSYWKTDIPRSGWRVPGPLDLDDEEDGDEILDDLNGIDGIAALSGVAGLQKKGIGIGNTARFKQTNQAPGGPVSGGLNGPPGLVTQQTMKRRRRYFYCLSFQVEFDYDDDKVYFAYSTPYSYSKIFIQMINTEIQLINSQKQTKYLASELKVVDSDDKKERQITTRDIFYERKMFAKTLSGLPVPIITMTSRRHKGLDYKKRQGICVSARVHPGETNSNFVFEGLLNFLITQEGVTSLLQNYVFKLFPCLNPDGNVCGNYRSSLAGVDLNRQWIYPNKEIHPIVFKAKDILSQFSKERQLLVYCDLHCHSKKKNSFIYGCNTAANGGFTSWTKTRLLPRIFARQTPLFNIKDCRFRIDPDKLGTARVIIWKEFGVTNSFTLENSFFGYQIGNQTIPFEPSHYLSIGENLMRSLIEYRACLKQIEKELIETKGWLKPKLLLEVTGMPAAQKMADEQAEKLKKEEKLKKIEIYRQNLGLSSQIDQSPLASQQQQKTKQGGATGPQAAIATLEKTRNLQKPSTLAQQIASPKTDSSGEALHRIPYKRQNTNQSDSKVTISKIANNGNCERRQNSSDSTNDLSMKKFTAGGTGVGEKDSEGQQRFQKVSVKTPAKNLNIKKKKPLQSLRASQAASSQDADDQLSDEPSRAAVNGPSKITVKMTPNKNLHLRNDSLHSQQNSLNKSDQFDLKADWREYFGGEELEEIFEQIEDGEDPNDMEDDMSMSDDNCSQDNLDINELYRDVYMRGNLLDKDHVEAKKAEEMHKKLMREEIEQAKEEALGKKRQIQIEQQISESLNDRAEDIDLTEQVVQDDQKVLIKTLSQSQANLHKVEQDQAKESGVGLEKSVDRTGNGSQMSRKATINYANQAKISKLQTPALNSKRPTSQASSFNQNYQKLQNTAYDISLGGRGPEDQNYQRIHDTSQDQNDMLSKYFPRPQLMYTFVNQFPYAHIGHNSKVLNRKGNIDIKVSKGIQGKSFANQINAANDTRHILQDHYQLQAAQSQQFASVQAMKKPVVRQPVHQNNGFSQYIQHSIKYEKQSIQQAYQRFNTNRQLPIDPVLASHNVIGSVNFTSKYNHQSSLNATQLNPHYLEQSPLRMQAGGGTVEGGPNQHRKTMPFQSILQQDDLDVSLDGSKDSQRLLGLITQKERLNYESFQQQIINNNNQMTNPYLENMKTMSQNAERHTIDIFHQSGQHPQVNHQSVSPDIRQIKMRAQHGRQIANMVSTPMDDQLDRQNMSPVPLPMYSQEKPPSSKSLLPALKGPVTIQSYSREQLSGNHHNQDVITLRNKKLSPHQVQSKFFKLQQMQLNQNLNQIPTRKEFIADLGVQIIVSGQSQNKKLMNPSTSIFIPQSSLSQKYESSLQPSKADQHHPAKNYYPTSTTLQSSPMVQPSLSQSLSQSKKKQNRRVTQIDLNGLNIMSSGAINGLQYRL